MKRFAVALVAIGCSGPAFEAGSQEFGVEETTTGIVDPDTSSASSTGGERSADNGSSTSTGETGGAVSTSGADSEDSSTGGDGTIGTTGSTSSTDGAVPSTTGDAGASIGGAGGTEGSVTMAAATHTTGSASQTVSTVSTATVNTSTATSTTGSGTTGGSLECDDQPDPDLENIATQVADMTASCCEAGKLKPSQTKCIISAQCNPGGNPAVWYEWGTCGDSGVCANHGLAVDPKLNGGTDGVFVCGGSVCNFGPCECVNTSGSTARCEPL